MTDSEARILLAYEASFTNVDDTAEVREELRIEREEAAEREADKYEDDEKYVSDWDA